MLAVQDEGNKKFTYGGGGSGAPYVLSQLTGSYQWGFLGFAALAAAALIAILSLKSKWRALWPTMHPAPAAIRL